MTDFRPMRDGEKEAVIGLWEACGLTRPWNEPMRDLDFARGKGNSEILVAMKGDRVIATVMAGHDGHRGTIYYLAVDPAQQGNGMGRLAVAAAESWLKERGVWKINLLIRRENAKVLGFYQALGYEPNDVVSLGRWLDRDA
ncbi:MAG: GNAT family acetyltransferase [Hyphomicrobiales bacterium]